MLEANKRLRRRSVTKKQLAQAFAAKGIAVSEMMVIRCLVEDESKRVPTIEAINAISDALGIPRPVVVADSIEEALELQAAVQFSAIDAEILALSAQVSSDKRPHSSTGKSDKGDDGEQHHKAMGDGRPQAASLRSTTVRRASRSR